MKVTPLDLALGLPGYESMVSQAGGPPPKGCCLFIIGIVLGFAILLAINLIYT